MKNRIKNILQHIEEVGMEQFEKEVRNKKIPLNISDDFKAMTDQIHEMVEEEIAIDKYLEEGNPIFHLSIKL